MYISSSQYLQFADCIWCPISDCPVQEYLSAQKDVLDVIDISDTSSADGGPETEAVYKLKLETEDIGNKFIKVYKEAQQICKQCWEQSHKKSK